MLVPATHVLAAGGRIGEVTGFMNTAAVRLLQTELEALGFYHDRIDGERGPNTHAAVGEALDARTGDLSDDWRSWSDKRKAVALLQLLCTDQAIDAGTVDGWWGPQTEFAVEQLDTRRRTGALPPPWRDVEPIDVNPHGFPDESHASLTDFYGPHGEPDGYRPPLRKVTCPWKLKIAWNMHRTRSHLWCHEAAADSLAEVLEKVHEHYGENEIEKLRLDLFGGDYHPRRKRGGVAWSTHSWGIAIDWDPGRNRLKWGRGHARLAEPEYEDWWRIWEAQGWTSLGRVRNFDWMHVQATKL